MQTGKVLLRLLNAGVSCLTAWWTYRIGSVLFGQDHTFDSGDPFVIVLLPFFLVFLLLITGVLAGLIFISTISAAYAVHPPLAVWILDNLHRRVR